MVMKLMIKAACERTIVLGSTGCMYVANTTYYTTPWVCPGRIRSLAPQAQRHWEPRRL